VFIKSLPSNGYTRQYEVEGAKEEEALYQKEQCVGKKPFLERRCFRYN
jgi:hypothetical protein